MHPIHIITHEFNHCGVCNAAVTLGNALVERGIPVRMVVVGPRVACPFAIDERLELVFLGRKRRTSLIGKIFYLLGAIYSLSRYLMKEKPQRLFVWAKEFSAISIMLRCALGLKCSIIAVSATSIEAYLHNQKSRLVPYLLRAVYQATLKHADHVIAQSKAMLPELTRIYDIPLENITTIYPPLNRKFFDNVSTTPLATRRDIVCIGRLTTFKDPICTLAIIHGLLKGHPHLLHNLRFIGEGDLLEELKEQAVAWNIEERVFFMGHQKDTLPFLQKAAALIMTSKYEGFGMVLAEAIACGVPVVAFDCPVGPSEIIQNGINGYLIPPGDRADFVDKLYTTLTQDWDSKKIAETANIFHPDGVIQQYLDVIQRYAA